jgi:hypothetical protein
VSTITIDANQLAEAAPKVGRLYATVSVAARELAGADVSCEMPDGLAGRIIAGISAAQHDLDGTVRTLDGLDGELKKRAHLARIADAVGMANFGLTTVALPTGIINAAAADSANHIPANVGSATKAIGGVLAAAGLAGDLVDLGKDYRNPFIDDNRKAADALAKGVTASGVAFAGGVGAGLAGVALVSVPGVGIAVGVGLGYAVLDKQLHITAHVSDGINSALDAGGEALDDVGDALGGLF